MEHRQRSRKGCLTCRQKRKKCDEIKPVCGRCEGGDDCVWPTFQSTSRVTPRPSRLPRIQPRPPLDPEPMERFSLAETTPTPVSGEKKPTSNTYFHESKLESLNTFPKVTMGGNPDAFTLYPSGDFWPAVLNTSNMQLEVGDSLLAPTLSTFGIQGHPLGLRSGHLPAASNTLVSPLAFTCVGGGRRVFTWDEDEEEVFGTMERLSETLQLYKLYFSFELSHQDQVQWSSAIDSYFTFFIRNSYDLPEISAHTWDLIARSCQVESVRLGILSTSLLFYSFLNPEVPQAPLRKYAKEFIDAAASALEFEESQPNTTLSDQLAGISEILVYYYYVGDLGSYLRYIDRALPIVQQLVGATPVGIHKLYGPETVDIRIFAWCDVFSAIATSRPTGLVYDCNVDAFLQRNQEGPDLPLSDSGLEWICGLPDAFLLLTIQILNLKHAPISQSERISRAVTIEATLRGWKVWPSNIPNSIMRVQRVSAQEIWRHFTILYLYQAIHKATPIQEVVQQSVKQIIRLASTLRPGHNPDCLLYIPYFLAGTFAISTKDRQFIRNRVMQCGINTYMKTVVNALDELWKQPIIDKHVDWTSMEPPLVVF